MRPLVFAGAIALASLTMAVAHAGPVPDRAPNIVPDVASAAAPSATNDWLEAIAGKTLTAVDGSTLTMTPRESGIERRVVSANGEQKSTTFVFISSNLGTVNDDTTVIGFFRRIDNGFAVTFEDGRNETIATAPGGGIVIALQATDNTRHCRGWYPADHTFSETEKRAAVAAYALRLGITASGIARAPALDRCAGDTTTAQSAPESQAIVPAAKARRTPRTAAPTKQAAADLPPLTSVDVRPSDVHPVDVALASDAPASADAAGGASLCLKVDSDGGHWGFRNRCAFDVSFAFCLKNAGSAFASCDRGPEAGLAIANGFTPLMKSSALGGNETERNFRWVACDATHGGETEAHLDQTSPPAGHCTRAS